MLGVALGVPLGVVWEPPPLGVELGVELGVLFGVLLGSGEAVPPPVPEDAPPEWAGSGTVGWRWGWFDVPVEPPISEVPLPGSSLTTAVSGLPATSSTAVTVPIARTNTSPVAIA